MEAPRIETRRQESPQQSPPPFRTHAIYRDVSSDESFGKGLSFAAFFCGLGSLVIFFAAPISLFLSSVGLACGIVGFRSLRVFRSGWIGLAAVSIVLCGVSLLAVLSFVVALRFAAIF